MAGCFTTQVNVCDSDNSLQGVKFYVIEEKGQPLLGKVTAIQLGVLHIGESGNPEPGIVQQITDTRDKLMAKYPECFEGLGKLKDFQLKIAIDDTVKPVVQPLRRIPYHLRDKVEQKLLELESYDIIEKVTNQVIG